MHMYHAGGVSVRKKDYDVRKTAPEEATGKGIRVRVLG